MKLLNKIASLTIEFSFYLLVVLVPLFFTASTSELFEFNKIILTYFLTIIIIGAWLIKSITSAELTLKRSLIDVPIIIFLLSQSISTIFSLDPHTSILGYYSRFNGGLLSTLTYLGLFYAAISNLNQTKFINIINLSVVTAVLVSIWGILSHFNIDLSCKLIVDNWSADCWSANFQPTLRIFSTLGQPNWLAAYLSMLVPANIFLGISSKNRLFKVYCLISTIILFWAFILTNSRAATLGLFISLLTGCFILIKISFQHKSKFVIQTANLTLISLILISFSLITWTFGQQLLGRLKVAKSAITTNQPLAESQESNTKPGGTESGKIRLIVWQGAIEIFKHYPIIGSGVETFGYAYYKFRPPAHNLTTEWNLIYNKAHNEYLNYLANSGILGLFSYLFLIGIAFYLAYQNLNFETSISKKLVTAGIITGLLANLIQNFFGFSVVTTSLFTHLYFAGLIIYSKNTKDLKVNLIPVFKKNLLKTTGITSIILLSSFAIRVIFNYWLADIHFSKANSLAQAELNEQAIKEYQQAISLSPFKESLYYSNLASVLADLAIDHNNNNKQAEVKNYSLLADSSIETSLRLNPANVNNWRTATQSYLKLSLIDTNYLGKALNSAETAATLAPTEPEINYQLALAQKLSGYESSAAATLEKTIRLKPDYQKAIDELNSN